MRGAALASGNTGAQAFTGSVTIYGYSARESAGTPAVASLVLRNGTSAAGAPIAFITLAAGGSQIVSLPGIDCPAGVFADRLTGTSEVVLFVA